MYPSLGTLSLGLEAKFRLEFKVWIEGLVCYYQQL